MSRSKDYQRLLNSKKWRELRAWKLQQNPLCEVCQANGYVRSAVDVHHKVPVESARTPQEMEQLCFNPSNLQALCIQCHCDIHRKVRSHSKDAHAQRERERLDRWKTELERRVAKIASDSYEPGGAFLSEDENNPKSTCPSLR